MRYGVAALSYLVLSVLSADQLGLFADEAAVVACLTVLMALVAAGVGRKLWNRWREAAVA